jgi:hypothetical protein
VLWAALDVPDAVLPQELLERRLTAPRGVLPAVVRQYLTRHAVRRDAPLERFDHQGRLVVVREHVRDDEARVVVEERRHVELLVPSQPELEDVRLPHLVRLGPFEAAFGRRCLWYRRLLFRQQSLLVEDAPHLRRRDTQRVESPQRVRDLPGPEVRKRLLHGDDRVERRARDWPLRLRPRLRESQPGVTELAVLLEPARQRLVRDAEHPRHAVRRQLFFDDALDDTHPELRRVAMTIRATGLSSLPCCFPSHRCLLLSPSQGALEGEGAMDFGARSNAH